MNKSDAPWVSPHSAWLDAHPEEVERYRGQHVALHPTLGIVCAAKTLAELFAAAFPVFDAIKDDLMIEHIGGDYAPVPLGMPVPRARAEAMCAAHQAPDIGCRGGPTCTPSSLASIWSPRYDPPKEPPPSALEIRLKWSAR